MTAFIVEAGIVLALFATLAAAWFVGKRIGHRLRSDLATHPQLGNVQGAILALLSLLLGFCFAGAMSRFVERQEIIANESNAITTLYTRADLLPAELRDELRATVRAYAAARLRLSEQSGDRDEVALQGELNSLLDASWITVTKGVDARPHFASLLVPACNAVGDLLQQRNAASHRHIPLVVVIVLGACAIASIIAIGLGVETADTRLRMPAAILVFLIAATLWITIDLDFPRVGFARVSLQPLIDAAAQTDPARSPR